LAIAIEKSRARCFEEPIKSSMGGNEESEAGEKVVRSPAREIVLVVYDVEKKRGKMRALQDDARGGRNWDACAKERMS